MTMTVPVVPVLPAGYTVQASDLNELSAVATFLMGKPYVHLQDQSGGYALGSGDGVIQLNGVTSGLINNGTSGCIDTDGLWASGTGYGIIIQTPGWYRCKYGVRALSSGGASVLQAWLYFSLGANNPMATFFSSGLSLYQSQAVFNSTTTAALCNGGGVSPFPLYPGDQVYIEGGIDGGSASTSIAASAADNTFLEAEWVSTV